MWDERKFFEDYAKKANTVQPKPEFVEKMVSLVEEESKSSSSAKKVSYIRTWVPVAVAACMVLLLGTGGLHLINSKEQGMEHTQMGQMAGTEDKLDGQMESFGVVAKEESLQSVVEAIQKEDGILDNAGKKVSEEKKAELLELVLNGEATEELKKEEAVATYVISGKEDIVIQIMENNYFIVEKNNKNLYYQVLE